jgi:hypothetical protein
MGVAIVVGVLWVVVQHVLGTEVAMGLGGTFLTGGGNGEVDI